MRTLLPTEASPQSSSEAPKLRDDTKFAAGKIAFFQYAAVAVFLFLASGFWSLQIQNPGFYKEMAEQNSIKSIPILGPRGKILDRDGRVIVDNHSSFSLILSRETLRPEHLREIADGLNLDYEDLVGRLNRFKRPKYEPIVVKEELTTSELDFVESHRDPQTFPEMELIQAQRRLYPREGLAAHVIGYVGEVSEAELDNSDTAKYHQGDIIGKAGIEKQYNDLLMGKDGQRRVVVDNFGRERGEPLEVQPESSGTNVQLTLDLDLQTVAELAMEGKRGAVVALDPRSGEVLAMVSRPAYDPNKFAGRIRAKDWKEIINDPDKPLYNRAIQAQLAPGSTFKPFVALAGLETGVIDDKTKFTCPGGAVFYGRYFKCHKKSGHGGMDVHRGLAQSCDVFFYNVGNKLGIDRIAQYAGLAGMGTRTGIDLPQEKEGVLPSSAWKIRNYRQKWYAGETISVAIGQGALTVSPLQLAAAIGGIANGGNWAKPHLLASQVIKTAAVKRGNLNPENVAQVISGMYAVVNEGGTGHGAALPGIRVCGKTGTAQLASNDLLKNTKLGREMKDNAWFEGFAPQEAPEIVVVALFENGEHGPNAAWIVRDVMKAYFDKKALAAKKRPPVMLGGLPDMRSLLAPLALAWGERQ